MPFHHDVILCYIPPIEVAAFVAGTAFAEHKFCPNEFPGLATHFSRYQCVYCCATSHKRRFTAAYGASYKIVQS